ncbi:MAG: tetratricopeptide repeat protein [bacterium]
MLAKKKKLSKKQIKEDKLVTSFYNTKEFYEKYKSKIFMIVGAIAVVVIAIVLYRNKIADDNMNAATKLSEVMSLYESGLYKEAIEGQPGTKVMGLAKIADEYGSSENGELAKIYAANSYYYLGKIDQALEFYDDYSGSNAQLKATALAGQANCFENKKDYEEAAKYFYEASFVDELNPLNAEYLLKAGINYLNLKNNEEAKKTFELIKEKYPKAPVIADVERYLALVNLG